jgi:hypothetical protein
MSADMSPESFDRRGLLSTIAGSLAISALTAPSAWARGRPEALDAWARRLVGLKDDLRGGRIDVVAWQQAVEQLNASVPVRELVDYLDVDALVRRFTYASALAEAADPALPPEIVSKAGMHGWFVRVFGLRRGGAIVPHVHNEMVSAHLVIAGSFRARTHDRLRDLPDAILLRPTRDGVLETGEVISMSDRRDNGHWLVALEDRSMTFDVGVLGLPPSWAYGRQANKYNMIYVDPTVTPERDGTIAAPVLTFEAAAAKFAA